MTNVNEDAVRGLLNERLQFGRGKMEAAGEAIWLYETQQRMEILSEQTRRELDQVVDAWLAVQVGSTVHPVADFLARDYANYLYQQVDLKDLSPAGPRIDAALIQWRKLHGYPSSH